MTRTQIEALKLKETERANRRSEQIATTKNVINAVGTALQFVPHPAAKAAGAAISASGHLGGAVADKANADDLKHKHDEIDAKYKKKKGDKYYGKKK